LAVIIEKQGKIIATRDLLLYDIGLVLTCGLLLIIECSNNENAGTHAKKFNIV